MSANKAHEMRTASEHAEGLRKGTAAHVVPVRAEGAARRRRPHAWLVPAELTAL